MGGGWVGGTCWVQFGTEATALACTAEGYRPRTPHTASTAPTANSHRPAGHRTRPIPIILIMTAFRKGTPDPATMTPGPARRQVMKESPPSPYRARCVRSGGEVR